MHRIGLFALEALLLLSLVGLQARAEPLAILKVDGVGIGMDYAEVFKVAGRPKVLREKRGLVALVYSAPPHRPQDTEVWFSRGKVVYCSGYTLEESGEPLHLFGLPGTLLNERFGPTQVLQVFASWWPESGVVLAGSNNIWPEEALKAPIALRDPAFPLRWFEQPDGQRYSEFEPWVDDEQISWLAGDVELGMPEEKARNLAGDLDVIYRGGFVQAIESAPEALLIHRVGHHDFSVTFEVGQAPQAFGPNPKDNAPPENGWYSPASAGRIRMKDGKVAEIRLELDASELFDALEGL